MLNNETVKIKLVLKKLHFNKHKSLLIYFCGVLILLAGVGYLILTDLFNGYAYMKTGESTYRLQIVNTSSALEKGLGDRSSMGFNQGMLFVFQKPAFQCFWMKGMHFSLDMIWLNNTKQVVAIEQNVSPDTYPQTFCPNVLSLYVIELDSGQVKTAGIKLGQTLNFKT